MLIVDLSIERIRAYRRYLGMNVSEFARHLGVYEALIRHMDKPNWSPTADTLRRLERPIPDDFMPPGVKIEREAA